MAKYIIFLNGELKGYLNDEPSTKRAVSDLADSLIIDLKNDMIRVFRENVDNGIKIYTQEIGNIFNGYVNLVHSINWCTLPEYRIN
jgi:hypothetical protein